MIATSNQEHKIQYKNVLKIKIQYNHANASIYIWTVFKEVEGQVEKKT